MAHPEVTFGGDAEFLQAFDRALSAAGSRRRGGPTSVIEKWGGFVERCDEGYLRDIEEFHFDLSVRQSIETLRRDPELLRFPDAAGGMEVGESIAGISAGRLGVFARWPRPPGGLLQGRTRGSSRSLPAFDGLARC